MLSLKEYMILKGKEYKVFDKNNVIKIFSKLKKYIPSKSKNIQIIGTNGKGSTGRFITLILLSNKYRVLHFTSPHIFNFNERFYKNGNILSDKELEEAHNYLQKFDFINNASYFEYATFLAYYLSIDVDYAIFEAGVGGEFDSTSVLHRDLCVFSMIDYDHQDLLGGSLEKIATTKLNAMVNPSIIGIQLHNIIKDIAINLANKKNIKLHFLESVRQDAISYIKNHNLASFLNQNLSLALIAMDVLGIKYNLDNLEKFDLQGRFQKIRDNIIIDVGHNISAAYAIKKELRDKKIVLIYNSYLDKDFKSILKIMKNNISRVEIIEIPNNERIVNKNVLKDALESMNINYCDFNRINDNDNYLVFGSFIVIEKFMRHINE